LPERYYSRFSDKKKRNWKFWVYFILIISIILLFIFKGIEIQFTLGEENTSIVWSLMIGFVWSVYLNILGFSIGIKKNWQRILLIVIIVIVYLYFAGYLGIRIILNYPFNILFPFNTFATNTRECIDFFWNNYAVFSIVWFGSLWTQMEV
jgi:hypothetical protein